jgi:hypothetical protein
MDIKETEWKGVGWSSLAEDKDKWWAVADAVMNLWVP